jgi:hypothetical protein
MALSYLIPADSNQVCRIFSIFRGNCCYKWFRYGSGTAPPPTQPPIIEKIQVVDQNKNQKQVNQTGLTRTRPVRPVV